MREKIILIGAVALLAFSPTASFGQPKPGPTKPTVIVDDPAGFPRCPDSVCPDRSEIFHTCDCNLADNLVSHPRFPQSLVPVRSKEADNWFRRNNISQRW